MSQKLPICDFKRVKESSQFNRDFIENYNEDSHKGYFLEVDVTNPEILHELDNDLSLPERIKVEKVEKLVTNLDGKKRICYTHRKFKTSIESKIIIEKSPLNSIKQFG